MTDTTPTPVNDQDQTIPPPSAHDNQDILFQDFVGRVNDKEDGRVSVTVFMGGMILSGVIIPGKTYFEEMSKAMPPTQNENGEEGFNMFSTYIEAYSKGTKFIDDIKYFHMRVSKIWGAGIASISLDEASTLPIRGKICDVSAFSLGTWTQPQENE